MKITADQLDRATGMQSLSITLAVLMARHVTPISPYLLAVLVVLRAGLPQQGQHRAHPEAQLR